MNNITIDIAKIDDIQGICRLFDEASNYHSEALPQIFTHNSKRDPNDIVELMENINCRIYVAKSNKHMVGVAVGLIKEAYDHPVLVKRKYGWVDALAVTEEYRHRGVGLMLMDNLQKWFISNSIMNIELNVWEFNSNAIKLYEKLGYTTIKRVMSIELYGQ